jgi:hypothetical protein
LYTILTVVARLADQSIFHQLPASDQQQQQTQPPAIMLQAQTDLEPALPPAAVAAVSPAQQQQQQSSLREALRQLDLAALMGGLCFRPWVNKLIDAVDSQLQQLQTGSTASGGAGSNGICSMSLHGGRMSIDTAAGGAAGSLLPQAELPAKQQKLEASQQPQADTLVTRQNTSEAAPEAAAAAAAAGLGDGASVPSGGGADRVSLPPGSLTSRSAVVPVEHAPSMEHFLVRYLLANGEHQCRRNASCESRWEAEGTSTWG